MTISTPSVNLHTSTHFTKDHSNILVEYLREKEKRFPQRYSVEHLKVGGLKLSKHCELLEKKYIVVEEAGHFTNNLVWAGGVNNNINDIKNSLSENGFELTHPPIAVYFDSKTNKYHLIDGRTRFKFLNNDYSIENVIVDVYEKLPSASERVVELGCGKLQAQANLNREIAGKVTDKDVISNVHSWIARGFIKKENAPNKKQDDLEPDLTSIIEFLNDFYNPLYTTSNKKIENLAKAAKDTYNQNTKRLVWTDVKDVQKWLGVDRKKNIQLDEENEVVDEFDEAYGTFQAIRASDNCYVDIPYDPKTKRRGITHLEIDTTQARRTVAAAANHARMNPNCEIRLIAYVKQITDYENPIQQFNNETRRFVNTFKETLTKISECYFNGAPVIGETVKIYGVAPSLRDVHNLKELILYDDKHDVFYQKNGKSFNGISSHDLLNTVGIDDIADEEDND